MAGEGSSVRSWRGAFLTLLQLNLQTNGWFAVKFCTLTTEMKIYFVVRCFPCCKDSCLGGSLLGSPTVPASIHMRLYDASEFVRGSNLPSSFVRAVGCLACRDQLKPFQKVHATTACMSSVPCYARKNPTQNVVSLLLPRYHYTRPRARPL